MEVSGSARAAERPQEHVGGAPVCAHSSRHLAAQAAGPAWGWFLAGAVLALAVPVRFASAPEPTRTDADHGWQLERMGPRELRRLTGLGQGRALAIARLRWSADRAHPPRLTDVRGIGPKTWAAVAADLARRRAGAPAAAGSTGAGASELGPAPILAPPAGPSFGAAALPQPAFDGAAGAESGVAPGALGRAAAGHSGQN